jgi:hypothetical protein
MENMTERNNQIRNDLFAAIDYEERRFDKKHTVKGKELGAHFVFAWIFEDAWNFISAGIAKADKYKFHSAKSLFNNAEVWAGYERPTQIAIGRCLAYFVDNKMMPLACVNPDGDGTKLYRILG